MFWLRNKKIKFSLHALKTKVLHLVMFQAFVAETYVSRVTTSVKAGFQNCLNSLHCVLIKVNEHLK